MYLLYHCVLLPCTYVRMFILRTVRRQQPPPAKEDQRGQKKTRAALSVRFRGPHDDGSNATLWLDGIAAQFGNRTREFSSPMLNEHTFFLSFSPRDPCWGPRNCHVCSGLCGTRQANQDNKEKPHYSYLLCMCTVNQSVLGEMF